MDSYTARLYQNTTYKVTRKSVVWQVIFELPDMVKEQTPYEEYQDINGHFSMNFYCDPQVGDLIEYQGHTWEIAKRLIFPTKYRKHEVKRAPIAFVNYIGKAE